MIKREHLDKQFEISRNQLINLNLFWISVVMYLGGYSLYTISPSRLSQLLQLSSLLVIFWGIVSLIKFELENSYLKLLYTLYGLWFLSLFVLGVRSFFDKTFLLYFLLNPLYGGMLYLVPAVLLFPKKPAFYKKAFDAVILFCVIYILYDFISIGYLISSDQDNPINIDRVETSFDLGISCGFILLTYQYHSNKKKLLALLTILLVLFFAIVRARRGLVIMASGVILSSYLLYLFYSNKKILVLYLSVLVIILGAFYAANIYNIQKSRIFSFIAERGKEDTRTGVELYFYADMTPTDWIIGKGISGEYYCPDIDENAVTNYRSVIETGYLQIILKGGLVSLILLILITVPAIFKGIFYSKNILSKAAGIWILLALLSLYPATVNTFSMRYLLVWISVGICYSNKIRNIPDEILGEYFLGKSTSSNNFKIQMS
jgi:hypothetical protein